MWVNGFIKALPKAAESLEQRIFGETRRKWDFPVAAATYLAASAGDGFFTASACLQSEFREFGPVVHSYMSQYGDPTDGMILAKSAIVGSVLLGMKALDMAYEQGKTLWRPEHLLYPGSLATVLPGLVLLCDNAIVHRLTYLLGLC